MQLSTAIVTGNMKFIIADLWINALECLREIV